MGIADFIERLLGIISFIWLAITFPKFWASMMIILLALEIKEVIEFKNNKGDSKNG
ncbi:MAG: hypothetical protein PHY44_01655 [Lachnospiraceae bacterium]|nr:hypothetical protein [Lachnospiraceae bacterium]